MIGDNGEASLERDAFRKEKKQAIQEMRQEEAELEAQYKRQKEAIKQQTKSLQEQLGAAPEGISDAQYKQAQKDEAVINDISQKVNEEWNKSRASILKASRYLFEAKLGVKKIHGASWSFLCQAKLPFGKKTADRLVEIGGCEFIHTHADDLPAAYTTLYEIAKMDADLRQKAFDNGDINQSTWRKNILDIVDGKKKIDREEQNANQVRTLPIGILNVPVKFFQKEDGKKTIWLEENVKLFQAECMQALKGLIEKYEVDGAPNMIDFSKINQTLEKQAERANKKVVIDYSGDQSKVCSKLKKAIKEAVQTGSWKDKYTGSDEKRQNLHADLLSEYNVGYLASSLMEVKGAVDWSTFTIGHITEEMLISMANAQEKSNT
jgi:hypothetical protein